MELIDERGNLLGVVNVIDALVVVFVLGVVIAGVAALGGDTEEAQAVSQHVTIEFDDQPVRVAELVSEGDTMVNGDQRLTITEVYVGPGGNGRVSITVAAAIEWRDGSDQSSNEFADGPVRPGRRLAVRTSEYDAEGTITAVRDDEIALDVTGTSVTVRTTVDNAVAHRIRRGDTYELAGQEVGTVDSVSVFRTDGGGQQRVLLDLELRSLRGKRGLRFGGVPLKIGTDVPFTTDGYEVSATVVDRDGLDGGPTTETVTAVVKLENVEPEFVNAVAVGDEERTRGKTYARVTDRRVEPAVVIVTSADGNVNQRDHPRNKDVYLTVELTVQRTRDGILFHGERLQAGTDVVLDFETIAVRGTVTELEGGQ